jgi:hypothetical protein
MCVWRRVMLVLVLVLVVPDGDHILKNHDHGATLSATTLLLLLYLVRLLFLLILCQSIIAYNPLYNTE